MRKIFSNFIYQASSQILMIIIPIITVPVISRALGPSGVGSWNYVNSIVSYFILLGGLGLSTYGVKEIAIVSSDKNKLSKKFWELELFSVFFSFGSFLAFIIMSFFTKTPLLYLTQGFAVFSALLDITWFFSGIERFKSITIRNLIVKTITFICVLIFIKEPGDLWKYFLINSLSVFFSQLSLWLSINKYIHWVKVSFSEIWQHFMPTLTFFTAKVGTTIYTNINKTLLGVLGTLSAVGIYSNALTMILMLAGVIGALNVVMLPRMSSLQNEDNEDAMIRLLEQVLHLQLFVTIAMTFGIVATNEKMIVWFFGEKFHQLVYVVPLLAPTIIIQSLHVGIATQYLIPKNEMKSYNYSILVGAILAMILDFIFIPFIGIYGAVLGTMAAQIIVCIIRVYILLKNTDFKFDVKKILGYFFVGAIMTITIQFTTKSMESSFMTTILQTVLGVIIYWGGTWGLNINPLAQFIKLPKFIK